MLAHEPRGRFEAGVKLWALSVSLAAIGAMLSPAVIPGASDSFPLSTFPMFSSKRPETTWTATARGVTTDGQRVVLPTAAIANSEPMQAVATLKRALRGGAQPAQRLCGTIAGRLDRPDLVAVELRWERHSTVGYFLGETEPEAVRRVARCSLTTEPAP